MHKRRFDFLEFIRDIVRIIIQEIKQIFDGPPQPPTGLVITFEKEEFMLIGTVKLSGPTDDDVCKAHLIVETDADGITEHDVFPVGEFFPIGEPVVFPNIRVTKNSRVKLSATYTDEADNHSALFVSEEFIAVLTDVIPPASPTGITPMFDREE